jgi:hypothetical protein
VGDGFVRTEPIEIKDPVPDETKDLPGWLAYQKK